jgi:hypothetical protein
VSPRSLGAIVLCVATLGCGEKTVARAPEVEVREAVPFLTGPAQNERLCSRLRTRFDRVLQVFCVDPPPEVTSFVELRALLGLESNENDIYQGFVLNANSTALASHAVSAINPRIMFMRPQGDTDELLMLAFARGEKTAEMVARDSKNDLQFYLLTYSQDCDFTDRGCVPGDLLTDTTESGWQGVDVYGEEDLENTPLDCRVCHQPDGPGTTKFLRMQEFDAPWSHWFWRQSVGGRAVLDDYYAAKANEAFAGLPGEQIVTSQPGLLNYVLFSIGTPEQPNAFPSAQIEREVEQSAAARGGNQPADNSVPGESKTWNALYERAKRGEAIPVPYHDVKVTDPDKLAAMTQAYVDFREGRLAREALPDIRDVYPDDGLLRAQMGLATEPGLEAGEVLLQACGQCHNDRLDKTLSRSRFNVDLKKVSRAEKDKALGRIQLKSTDPRVMPPQKARALTEEGRSRLIALLKR